MEQSKILTPSIANKASYVYDNIDFFYFVGSGGGGGGGYGITIKEGVPISVNILKNFPSTFPIHRIKKSLLLHKKSKSWSSKFWNSERKVIQVMLNFWKKRSMKWWRSCMECEVRNGIFKGEALKAVGRHSIIEDLRKGQKMETLSKSGLNLLFRIY